MCAVAGQHDSDLVGNRVDKMAQEITSGAPFGFAMKLDIGKLADPIDGDKRIELALSRLNLGNVDMKIAYRICFERHSGRLIAFVLGQTADPMTLQATMQGRARQRWNCRLQRIEAIVEWQQRILPEGNDDSLFFNRQHR